jgi:hypothetical protein
LLLEQLASFEGLTDLLQGQIVAFQAVAEYRVFGLVRNQARGRKPSLVEE